MNNEDFTCNRCGHVWKFGENGNHDCLGNVVKQRDKLHHQRHELAEFVCLVINGCDKGSIKSQPLLKITKDAESYPMVSLREMAEDALTAAGYKTEKR